METKILNRNSLSIRLLSRAGLYGSCFALILAAIQAALALCQAQQCTEDEEFLKDLDKVKILTDGRKWEAAKKHIDTLLRTHKGKPIVYAKKTELEEMVKKCTFWMTHKTPDPKEAVSGKLEAFQLSTGKIKIRYKPDCLGDFNTGAEKKPKTLADIKETALQALGKYWKHIHPATFAGPYSIEIRGLAYPRSGPGPVLMVCLTAEEGYSVIFGSALETMGNLSRWYPARLFYINKEGKKEVDYREMSPGRPGKPYSVKVTVGQTSVCAYYNNRKVLSASKKKNLWGSAGFYGAFEFDEVIFSGQAEPSWLQGMIDRAVQEEMAAFEKDYQPGDHLPAWLFEKPEASTALKNPIEREWPGTVHETESTILCQARTYYEKEELQDGMNLAIQYAKARKSEAAWEFLLALFSHSLGQMDKALHHCSQVCEIDPAFIPAWELKAKILRNLGREDEGVAIYDDILKKYPGSATLYEHAVQLLLKIGQPEKAKAMVDHALRNSVTSEELEQNNALLVKAINGPPWGRTYESKSENYHVFSDIDHKTCADAAEILEDSYQSYTIYLEPVKDLEKKRFKVFLFSGLEGYKKHCCDLLGAVPHMSAGFYSPSIRQLFIWNVPSRDQMMRTVRHEGFHQYLDHIMDDPPLWFNEGLAEYYEISQRVHGRWKLGEVHKAHLPTLEKGLFPLETFLYQDKKPFMLKAPANYAQSWAFIHFLRHSTKENKKIFKDLWEAFKSTPSKKAAMDKVFGSLDMGAMQKAFEEHVRGMF